MCDLDGGLSADVGKQLSFQRLRKFKFPRIVMSVLFFLGGGHFQETTGHSKCIDSVHN
jgi:hypothetical protein